MIDLPLLYIQKMSKLMGDGPDFKEFLASFVQPSSSGLRVNLLKIPNHEVFVHSFITRLQSLDWCPEGYFLADNDNAALLGKHPYHQAGLYYLQDTAAMAAVSILDPQPGEKIIDIAAAPGGKSTHIASRLRGEGLLVANDIHPQRVWDLAENLERWGARNVVITHETPERLANHFGPIFDRVLMDAPCSGEGMFRKSESARKAWSPGLVQGCALRQTEILSHAARLVRPGGRLVYVTCTLSPEENEDILANFLSKSSSNQFEIIAPPKCPGFSPGRPDWSSHPQAGIYSLENAVRLWPHRKSLDGGGDGHFIALLHRKDEPEFTKTPSWNQSIPRQSIELWTKFCQDNFTAPPLIGSLVQKGNYVYSLPSQTPDLTGLRLIHPGLWLGQIKKDRFEPSHALALAGDADNFRRKVILNVASPEISAYLRGETFPNSCQDGWIVVCIELPELQKVFPIGWARCVNGILKNHYPRGLRFYS